MIKMPSHIETIVNTYRTLSKIPSVVSGKLIKNGSKITSKWSVRNLDKGKHTKYLYNYVLNDNFNRIAESEFGIDVSNELLSAISPQETFKAIIREEKEKESKKQYLEVWQKNNLLHSIDLSALDIHGDVYADGEFGCLNWSQDESAIAYVAEKKPVKSEPYIKRKAEEKPESGSGETALKKGQEHLYRQDWGEQLVGKYMSVIVVCTLSTETCTVLEGLPEGWCPGQVRFSPDGQSVVGVAWETLPRRLGLMFCTNRPSYIFSLSLDGVMKKISKEGFAVRSPRFSATGDLFWLQRTTGGPHHACHSLVTVKKGQTEVTTVVDVIQDDMKISNDDNFYGLYCASLPAQCFSADNKRMILSTPQRNEIRSYVVDIDGSRVVDISNRLMCCSTTVLDVKSDIILAACSNLTTPGQLYVARLPAPGSEGDIQWVQVSEPCELPPALSTATVEYMTLTHEGSSDPIKSFSAIYFAPKVGHNVPLIVWPHGGPHGNFVNAFSVEAALFNALGFACLQVNYRGSTGAGQASVSFLPKRVGDADVKDCKLATDEAVKKYSVDAQKLCLTGGSHGGFLVTHLSGQYPDTYRAVVTRNPVIDVASMFNSSDIPDCYNSRLISCPLVCAILIRRPDLLGLASVRVNYRGSTGSGESYVRCLLGNAGTYDTDDCLLALNTLLERESNIDRECVFLYGGSYGGFVIGHLAGSYPDMFRAMVMRNPLIDLATKGHYADNSDGCEVEAGFDFSEKGPVSEERLLAMRRASPLAHVHKVRAPTCLMLGSGDKRVPQYQGLEYMNRLRANGVTTRVYMYDDNHSLSSLPAEMDNLINGAAWFMEHL